VRVADGGLTIGRDYTAQCGPEIDDFTNVSRRHAEITTRDGQLFIEDQASTNGTTVNGSQIPPYQPQPLVDGDVVGFGARLRVIVSIRKPNQ
jgi:pSer/pThr/pTyr-binding forkhead associated (FHA) protein